MQEWCQTQSCRERASSTVSRCFGGVLCRKHDKFDEIVTFHLFSGPLASRLQTCLDVPQPLVQKTNFTAVANGPAREKPTDHDARGLELVHVLQDEDLHLLCPQRHIGAGGVLLDGGGVPPRERQVVQAVFRNGGGVCQPGPAAV